MTGRSILIIEDDKEIRNLLVHYLGKEGFSPDVAPDAETALAKLSAKKPDLILLDILLPGMDGFELLGQIRVERATSHLPVILITAKAEEVDKIVGFGLGADDYVTKPFSPREVIARIKAVFRRHVQPSHSPDEEVYEYKGLHMDVSRHEVWHEGKPVALTTKEFRVLQTLLAAEGRVLSREAIIAKVWSADTHVTDRTVDVHIAKIRQKIPAMAEAIETVKDVGYKLKGPCSFAAAIRRPHASHSGKPGGTAGSVGKEDASSKDRPSPRRFART